MHTFQCTRRSCRTCFGPNFYWHDHKKINTATVADITRTGVLFVSQKRCFTERYLKVFGNIHFRCFASSKGCAWSIRDAYRVSAEGEEKQYGKDFLTHYDEVHTQALMYYYAVKELEEVDLHKTIVIGDEISAQALAAYDRHLHQNVYPPADRSSIKEVVGDGHMKVAGRCPGASGKHSGRPAKSMKRTMKTTKCMMDRTSMKATMKVKKVMKQKRDRRSNGWFMLCDPRTQRVLCVTQMLSPECNATVKTALMKVLPIYYKCDTFVYDRNCSFAPKAQYDPNFQQLDYYPVEPWHGLTHKKGCKWCTRNVPSYKRRLKGVNCSVCEQTYAWFRHYARVLNEMRYRRHAFLVLYYVRRHNKCLAEGEADYLNEFAPSVPHARRKRSYAC